jgi:hypothetical protein
VPIECKWIALDPCLMFTESNSKLYTNFESCEEENHRHIQNILANHDDKKINNKYQEKSTYFNKQCKWCASRWYWTSDYLEFVLSTIKLR